jgi:tetratricopeptide (TPR) repeat protein
VNRHIIVETLVSVGILSIIIVSGCISPEDTTTSPTLDPSATTSLNKSVIQPVSLPDLSQNNNADTVNNQLRQQYTELTSATDNSTVTPLELSEAYGKMGKLFLATEYVNEAEVCFRNAQILVPRDYQWPYYLGHIYKDKDLPDQAAESFEQARKLEPSDVPTLVWLAEMHLEAGEAVEARLILNYALELRPDSLPIRFGLGRVALGRKDFLGAVQHLEEARVLSPAAIPIHTALASAYRSLGQLDRAEANLQRQRAAERAALDVDAGLIRPADPLMEDVERLVQSAEAYELRGARALNRGNYVEAVARFRSGLELKPNNLSLRHKLATSLAALGDTQESQEQLEEIVRRSPQYSKAHYSLGLLMEDSGQYLQAMARYTSAVRHDPSYAEARLRLAGLLRRSGRPDDAMAQYERVMAIDSLVVEAPFGYAMVLINLGEWAQARDRLADGMETYPYTPVFPLALARVLAAAPDDRVRNGQAAMEIMNQLSEEQRRIDLGETMAMALAEMGRYEEAASMQREAIVAARETGPPDLPERMAANLKLYEAGKPTRTPWREGELP